MKSIVNVNKNWGIGKDNDLLVHIPEDMKFFRKTTAGKIVIMGRKTLESFPGAKPLPGRVNLVITSDPSRIRKDSIDAADAYFPDALKGDSWQELEALANKVLSNQEAPAKERPTVIAAVRSPEEVLEFCSRFPAEEEYVIGGSAVYELLLPYCDECVVTVNDFEGEPDSYYPDLDAKPEWKHSETGEMREYEGIHYHFDRYTRV